MVWIETGHRPSLMVGASRQQSHPSRTSFAFCAFSIVLRTHVVTTNLRLESFRRFVLSHLDLVLNHDRTRVYILRHLVHRTARALTACGDDCLVHLRRRDKSRIRPSVRYQTTAIPENEVSPAQGESARPKHLRERLRLARAAYGVYIDKSWRWSKRRGNVVFWW